MAENRWTPHVTVATIVERQGQFLLVKEIPRDQDTANKTVYNQPAGHLDEGETLVAAAIRETREETGWDVRITHYLGVYRYTAANGVTYLRHGFVAEPLSHHPDRPLDEGIIEAVWMSYDEIIANSAQMRSPLVLQLIDDYRAQHIYPLAVLHDDDA